MTDQTNTTATATPGTVRTPGLCPDWCTLPPGHPYDPLTGRLHNRVLLDVPGATVEVSQVEYVDAAGEVVHPEGPGVLISGRDVLPAGLALQVAVALIEGANILDSATPGAGEVES